MKKSLLLLLLPICILFFVGCDVNENNSYLRIHIRANSNNQCDQSIKYQIKDLSVAYLTPKVKDCTSKEEVVNVLNNNIDELTIVINKYLHENAYNYNCNIQINNEFFPTRAYGELTLEADYYDALVINLGKGVGDNWWCVVYPPLCFNNEKVVYKSKIKEIIDGIRR